MKRDDNNRKESQVDEDNNYREGKVDLKKTFLKFYLKADCCKKNSVDSSQSQALK